MAKRSRILLVDDERDFLEPVALWLISKGHRVTSVQSGLEAVQAIRHHPFDVVFLDVVMPEMDGVETFQQIRRINRCVPVILMAAGPEDASRFARPETLGISGYFPKGNGPMELREVFEMSLKRIKRSRWSFLGTFHPADLWRRLFARS